MLLPQLPAATRQVASESWVLGKQSEIDPYSPQVLNLQSDVVKLYTNDYAKQWDALLNDIDVEPLTNLQQAVQALYVLVVAAIADARPAGGHHPAAHADPAAAGAAGRRGVAAGAAQAAGAAAASAANSAAGSLQGLFGTPPDRRRSRRARRSRTATPPLIAFVGKGPGAPIDGALKLLNDLQQQLAQVANAGPGAAAAPPAGGADPAQLLQAEAARDPQPAQRWLAALAHERQLATQRRLEEGGGGGVQRARRPGLAVPAGGDRTLPVHARSSPNDIPLDDFGRLFAPNGMINQFFNHAAPAVRRYLRRGVEGAGGRRRGAAGQRRAIWRSSSARRRSASCSSPAAAPSRACASTSRRRRWIPAPSR